MSENILILDVGNSNTKCFVYHVNRVIPGPDGKYDAIQLYQHKHPTPRCHFSDLIDVCKVMLTEAIDKYKPVYGMVVAFGDAFVYYDPQANRQPRYVFADEPVENYELGLDIDYMTFGFPTGQIELTGIRALRAKHQAEWKDIVPVNIAVGREVGGNSNWRAWDISQTSTTGEYNLKAREWSNTDGVQPCQSHAEVGIFQGMPLLAGGMDQGFVDTTETTPYVVAGTWLVTSTVHDAFKPTQRQREHGVRWYISGNGRYLAQTVRKSDEAKPLSDTAQGVIEDLNIMSVETNDYQKVRVFGAYGDQLAAEMIQIAPYVSCYALPYAEESRQAAIYVYKHKEAKRE